MSTTTPQLTLGLRIYMARRDARLEQQDLAEALHVSRAQISKWERDKTEPRLSQVKRIAELTNVDAEWLSGFGQGNASTPPRRTNNRGTTTIAPPSDMARCAA